MRKSIVAVYVLSVFFVIATINFTYQNAITGAVVQENAETTDKISGLYSIKPNFKVKIDYDLNEYEEIVSQAKTLIGLCSNQQPERCIDNILESVNTYSAWSTNCFNEYETIFYEFVEKYNNCLESEEKDKICEFSITNKLKNKELKISIIKLGEKTRIDALKGTEVFASEIINTEGPFLTTEINSEGNPDKKSKASIEFNIKYEDDKESINVNAVDDETSRFETFSLDNEISFYKFEDGSLALIDSLLYNSLKASKDVFNPVKRTFNFCVESENEFSVYDEKEKTTKKRKVEYRFALNFRDNIQQDPEETP